VILNLPAQAAHKISNRQHLIEEAKKAYAAKLVADKAGGPEAGESAPCDPGSISVWLVEGGIRLQKSQRAATIGW
jgi:hypothetical protein